MITRTKTDFSIDNHFVSLMMDTPFFAEISRHIKKVPTSTIPTACVAYDKINDNVTLGWNPKFFKTLGNLMIRGVIIHEFYHVIFGHLYSRRMNPDNIWGIATDLAINSIILHSHSKGHYNTNNLKTSDNDAVLPHACLIPGQWSTKVDGSEKTDQEKAGDDLGKLISELPPLKASEWYFYRIKDAAEKAKKDRDCKQNNSDQSDIGENEKGNCQSTLADLLDENKVVTLDSHEFWDAIPEDQRPVVEAKIKAIIEKAVKKADSTSNGWGNIPSDLVSDIRRSVSKIINWRQVLRQFVGTLIRGKRRTSIKRINKRYPYTHPGVTKGYMAKILVAIDQSGSVDNSMLELFFGELRSLNKLVEFDVIPFDCHAQESDIKTWNRGKCPDAGREKQGGTDFNPVTHIVNDAKNRGRWDGLLIMSDGLAPKPVPSRIKRAWVMGPGCKPSFETDELIINLSNEVPFEGAWR